MSDFPRRPLVQSVTSDRIDILLKFVRASRKAFDQTLCEIPETVEVDAVARDLSRGRIRCAVAKIDNRIVSVATLVGFGPTTELAGVGTFPGLRGRGYATAVSSFLIQSHFAQSGDLVWLSAGSPEAERVYTRLGFARIGANQLNFHDEMTSKP